MSGDEYEEPTFIDSVDATLKAAGFSDFHARSASGYFLTGFTDEAGTVVRVRWADASDNQRGQMLAAYETALTAAGYSCDTGEDQIFVSTPEARADR